MTIYVVKAWVKDSPNSEMIAKCETRSIMVARDLAKKWQRVWKVEQYVTERGEKEEWK